MEKHIFCNLDLLRLNLPVPNIKTVCRSFVNYMKEINKDTDTYIYFVSRNRNDLNDAKEAYTDRGYHGFNFIHRITAGDAVRRRNHQNQQFIFISGKDVDFHLAVNSQSLFIVPDWIPNESSAKKYGVVVDTPLQLFKFIKTLYNQQSWFAKSTIEPGITALSLMDARYRSKTYTENERDMIINFENLLKRGRSRNYYDILMYHFLAGMTNTTLFDDIELFGMIPSSDCSLNPDLFSFMHQVRVIKNRHIPRNISHGENILLRMVPKLKAHESYRADERANMGAIDEFRTLCVNPDFKNKIDTLRRENRLNLCIFDDYMTHGNTFNAVRNLFKALGANKMVFVSLGSFKQPFRKKDYTINGSVYNIGYTYSLNRSSVKYFDYDDNAKYEVDELYDIFNQED